MSQLTLEEAKAKYPKFYSKPHLWIGAIEILVDESFEIDGLYYIAGDKYNLSGHTLNELIEARCLDYIIPLFKPQEGEAFIKDLEQALDKTIGIGLEYDNEMQGKDTMVFTGVIGYCLVSKYNPKLIKVFDSNDASVFVDTSAYVDHLRDKGYYV